MVRTGSEINPGTPWTPLHGQLDQLEAVSALESRMFPNTRQDMLLNVLKDACLHMWCRHPDPALSEAMLMRIPLEELHADAASALRPYELIVLVSAAGEGSTETRTWQACVRLRRVHGLEQAVVLETG